LVVTACVAVAVGLAARTIVNCTSGAAGLSCRWAFNHVGATDDWRYFAESWETARVTFSTFHQLPSWNPYQCGGLVFYQDPQAPFPGPLFLLTFWWLPTGAAIKTWIIIHLLVGTLGARALIKDRGGNGLEQILGSVLMAANGFIAHHAGGGHLSFTPFEFLPLILWSFRRSLSLDVRWAVLTAALFALAFFEGGTYPVPLMLFAVGVESLARLGSAQDRRALLWSLPMVVGLFGFLSGLRLIPILRYLREHPRLVPLDDQMTLGEVFQTWLLRTHTRGFAPHPYVWPEFGAYVGALPVLLMVAGVGVALVRRDVDTRQRRIDLVLLAALIFAALGNIPGLSLFGLLHELPIYASLRVPSRFIGPAMVGFGLLAVSALIALRRLAAQHSLRRGIQRAILIIEACLVAGIAVDVCCTNAPLMQQGVDPSLPRAQGETNFYQASGVNFTQFPTFPVRGIGTRICYLPLQWKPSPGIVEGKVPQQKIDPPAAGTATQISWSPNAVEIEARLTKPALLIVNQNYETGWQASTGEIGAYITEENRFWPRPSTRVEGAPPVGLLAVSLPAGTTRVTVRHRPPGLMLGFLMTLLGLAAGGLALRYLDPTRVARLTARGRSWLTGA
jgi:hypothetical protein